MNWRVLAAVIVSLSLALGFASAYSQSSSSTVNTASVSLVHSYKVTTLGFAILNDTFTFKNGANTSAVIPTLQVGLPNSIADRASDLGIYPGGGFSMSKATGPNSTTVLTITPTQSSLGVGASANFSIKAVMNNVFNFSASGFVTKAPLLVLMSPSVNVNIASMNTSIIFPSGGYLAQTPTGFTASAKNATSPSFTQYQQAVQPAALASYLNFTSSSQTAFTPMTVESLYTQIVPTANGTPTIEESFTLHNLAGYAVQSVALHLLQPGLERVTVVPNTYVPLLDVQSVPLAAGTLTFAATTLGGPLEALSNMAMEVSYPLPASAISSSGSAVKLTLPTTAIIAAPVSNYTVALAQAKGITSSGTTSYPGQVYDPFTTSTVEFSYSLPVGWAADQAIPAAVLVFAVAFAMFAIQRPETFRKEDERIVRNIPDVLKAFDAKTGLETQYMGELASAKKGTISKADFDKMRDEITDLRNRAAQRLNEMRKELGSGKQYDMLGQVADAEREEDRAMRDLINLYFQWNGNRMNDETFRRLQPSYRKRVEGAVNHLSDLLHQVQTEER